MKISALITSLVLGISSVAVAAPSAPFVRDHRAPGIAVGEYNPSMSWQTLSNSERLRAGRDAVQLYTPVRASTLMLAANRGSMFVGRVQVTFANGRTQTVELNQRLRQGQPLRIDLAGRQRMVSRIVVIGRGGWGSSYRVLAA
jgi:hypothetical protein